MTEIINIDEIRNKIYTIRGIQIILDEDLAVFYGVETRNLNKAVKRNITRFPEDFSFQLTKEEYSNLMFQFGTSSKVHGGRRKLPKAFTEAGVATLSGILNSKKAIEVNIQIIRAFVLMRKFISQNLELLNEINLIKKKNLEYDLKFDKIFNLLQHKELEKGIFFEGQLFDAHKFISDLIRKAKKEIILIDNYIDENTLLLFNKREKGVKVKIYTKNITKNLKQDLEKYNSQYESIQIKEFDLSHDRFLLIDDTVYHIGASLKDIGKKWFGFSKMEKESIEIIKRLK